MNQGLGDGSNSNVIQVFSTEEIMNRGYRQDSCENVVQGFFESLVVCRSHLKTKQCRDLLKVVLHAMMNFLHQSVSYLELCVLDCKSRLLG